MKTIIREVKNHAPVTHLRNEGNYSSRIGFWGIVTEVNSQKNIVNVRSDNGFECIGLSVATKEWVNLDGNYITGERHLPTVGSRVFVLMPTNNIDSAFVLCSSFARYESNNGDFMAADTNEVDAKNNSSEIISQGGWKKTEQYDNGNVIYERNDKKISLTVNGEKQQQRSEEPKIELKAWETTIKVDENEIKITDKNNNEITIDSNGIKFGNQIGTFGALLSETLQQLITLKTVGSPASHTASPDFISKITEIKGKWDQIFK